MLWRHGWRAVEVTVQIGILGTGMVGVTLGTKLVERGHDVVMGSRAAGNTKAVAWVASMGRAAGQGTFADAAAHGSVVFNCTSGNGALSALQAAGAANLAGKVLVDVSNPLDFSRGFPPSLSVCNEDSLGEQIQRAFPDTRVVKSLNTVACTVMVDPSLVPGDHDIFVAGDDADAKATVSDLLRRDFGWPSVIDVGGISQSRGLEAWLLLWTRLYGVFGTPQFNLKLQIRL